MNLVMDDAHAPARGTSTPWAGTSSEELPPDRPVTGVHDRTPSIDVTGPMTPARDSSLSDPILFRSKLREMLCFRPAHGPCFTSGRRLKGNTIIRNKRGMNSPPGSDNTV